MKSLQSLINRLRIAAHFLNFLINQITEKIKNIIKNHNIFTKKTKSQLFLDKKNITGKTARGGEGFSMV